MSNKSSTIITNYGTIVNNNYYGNNTENRTTTDNDTLYVIDNDELSKFEKHKNYALSIQQILYDYYKAIGKHTKAENIRTCGNFLLFRQYKNPEQTNKLMLANFCKHPLCPLCSWRKSLKNAKITHKTLKIVEKEEFLYLLTLTISNVNPITKRIIRDLYQNSKKFLDKRYYSKSYLSQFEITYNPEREDYHPHIHLLFSSPMEHDTSENAIRKNNELWGGYYNQKYQITDIRPVEDVEKASFELCKYLCKSPAISTTEAITGIISPTTNLRQFNYAGLMREARAEAKEICTEEEELEIYNLSQYEYIEQIYSWITGQGYKKANNKI